jgi:hypothetical protein
MLQRYKLRLGDGTILKVDQDALSAWSVDTKAMVQPVGTGRWHLLRDFLAQERAAAPPLVYPKALPKSAKPSPAACSTPSTTASDPSAAAKPPAGAAAKAPAAAGPTVLVTASTAAASEPPPTPPPTSPAAVEQPAVSTSPVVPASLATADPAPVAPSAPVLEPTALVAPPAPAARPTAPVVKQRGERKATVAPTPAAPAATPRVAPKPPAAPSRPAIAVSTRPPSIAKLAAAAAVAASTPAATTPAAEAKPRPSQARSATSEPARPAIEPPPVRPSVEVLGAGSVVTPSAAFAEAIAAESVPLAMASETSTFAEERAPWDAPPEPFPMPEEEAQPAVSSVPVESTPFAVLPNVPVTPEPTDSPVTLADLVDEPSIPLSIASSPAPEPQMGLPGEDFPEQIWIADEGLPPIPPPPIEVRSEPIDDVPVLPSADLTELLTPGEPAGVQAMADDPALARTSVGGETPKAEDDVIPLKPLAKPKEAAGLGAYDESDDLFAEERPRSELVENVMNLAARAISAYDALLTGWIERLRGRLESPSSGEPEPEGPSLYERISERISGWIGAVRERAVRFARRERIPSTLLPNLNPASGLGLVSSVPPPEATLTSISEPPVLSPPIAEAPGQPSIKASEPEPIRAIEVTMPLRRGPAVPPPPPPRFSDPSSRREGAEPPVQPPPPITALPVLRLAEIHDEPKDEDVYQGEGVFPAAWRWTKRVVVTSGLVAGGVYAALNWEAWTPKAERLGRAVFTEIDRREQAERQRKALKEASGQLPYLGGKTIEMILDTSPSGILDPAEVFHLATEATDRGLAALSTGEREELQSLRGHLLDALRPSERERVHEYDEARTRRAVFPFEDRDVAAVLARGGEAMPAESRERLQALFAKAIAAGLANPAESGTSSTAQR